VGRRLTLPALAFAALVAWAAIGGAIGLGACDTPSARGGGDAADDARSARTKDESNEPADSLGPGCRRAGAITGVEADEACVVPTADPAETMTALRVLTATLTPDARETLGGGQINLRLALANTGKRPVAVVLEGEPPGGGPHYDWSLLTGLSPPRVVQSEGFKVRFGMKTLDGREISVDQLRLVGPATPPPVRLYRIVLAPQAVLTHSFVWLALGIPAPYPPFEDDAGHRIVPKTSPKPLPPGKYTVTIDVPFYGVAAPQRVARATVSVVTGS
jgi:hypothetical protein